MHALFFECNACVGNQEDTRLLISAGGSGGASNVPVPDDNDNTGILQLAEFPAILHYLQ